mmetsp:Transcript_10740/g.29862  ORF Transcript_10740/g.29862 Transcript_10740/m.29862 type:complete len:203 (-) Transcript_10740:1251-1859(-)
MAILLRQFNAAILIGVNEHLRAWVLKSVNTTNQEIKPTEESPLEIFVYDRNSLNPDDDSILAFVNENLTPRGQVPKERESVTHWLKAKTIDPSCSCLWRLVHGRSDIGHAHSSSWIKSCFQHVLVNIHGIGVVCKAIQDVIHVVVDLGALLDYISNARSFVVHHPANDVARVNVSTLISEVLNHRILKAKSKLLFSHSIRLC